MAKAKKNKRTLRNLRTRKRLWPDIDGDMVWNWADSDGYVHIPRTMPYFFKIMDDCSKSKPLSSTYFALWCRCWDESGFIKIKNPSELAWESGFSGQRAVTTWRSRIRILEMLGFIRTQKFVSEEHGYIVLLNPYKVVKELKDNEKLEDSGWLNALYERADAIGADDLEDDGKDDQ